MPVGAEFYAALFALHERMLAGDPTLLGEVARLIYEPLTVQLRQEFRTPDHHLLDDGVADGLMEYGRNPSQANATTGAGVMGFLVMRSKSRVLDAKRKDGRREVAEVGYAHDLSPSAVRGQRNVVELLRARTEHDAQAQSEAVSVPPPDIEARLDREAQIEDVLAGAKSEVDRRLLEMMFAGVRETAAYAAVLGIEAQPAEVQEATVKRHKDRLIAAAKRREESKHSPPKRRGRPSRRRNTGDGDRG